MFYQLLWGLSILWSPCNHPPHQVQEHLFVLPFKMFLQLFKTGHLNLAVLGYPIPYEIELIDVRHSKGEIPPTVFIKVLGTDGVRLYEIRWWWSQQPSKLRKM